MKTNLLVDTGLLAAILVAMNPRFSGLTIHEWLGMSLAAVVIIHLLLHWKWILGVGKKFFQKLWHTSRLKFVVDTLLFVDFVVVLLSGILISKVALPALGISLAQAGGQWRTLHLLSTDMIIFLVGLHFALNWTWVVSTVKRLVVAPTVRVFQPHPIPQPIPVRIDDKIR